eukprot:GHVP01018749.1.p1 GENE.GHVP01018749.1~~GHVP01018749.1.p1  ORF type:complete len:122 (-),score=26.49 GHVP01018749.1:487-852(-)
MQNTYFLKRNFLENFLIMKFNKQKQAERALRQQIERAARYQQRKQQIMNEASQLKQEKDFEEIRKQIQEKEQELNTLNSEFANASTNIIPEFDEQSIEEIPQESSTQRELRDLEDAMSSTP